MTIPPFLLIFIIIGSNQLEDKGGKKDEVDTSTQSDYKVYACVFIKYMNYLHC